MLKSQIKKQRQEKGSLVAYNVQNIAHLHILSKCAHELNKPVIAQFSARYIPYWNDRVGLSVLVDRYQKNGVYFYLDHCQDIERIKFCIDSGFAGVMFDGSSFQLDQNIQMTNVISGYINSQDLDTVLEVELGAIVGAEDGIEGGKEADYYLENDLHEMVNEGHFDLLALAIGNAHGMYETTSDVKPELLKKSTDQYPDLNLVLHGGSGLPEEMMMKCITYGVVKINVSTELKKATQRAIKDYGQQFNDFNENEWFDFAERHIQPLFEQHILKYTRN